MQTALVKVPTGLPIERLHGVRNFREVIEARDISLMSSDLYQFVTLHCGFIAHLNINGFKAAYAKPKDFESIFVRHFDRGHSYFSDAYRCDEVPYKGTGYTRAEIKQEFHRIVKMHIESIKSWSESRQRQERLELYRMVRDEFEGTLRGLTVRCTGCHSSYEVRVFKEGTNSIDLGALHCLFCAQTVSL